MLVRLINRTVLWLLLAAFVITLVPLPAAAQEQGITLEAALRAVKSHFSIPAEFSDFSSGFNQYQGHSLWSLNWRAPDGLEGGFYAQVDAKTGEITSMNCWKSTYGPNDKVRVPALDVDQAKKVAANTLKDLVPSRVDSLRPVPDTGQVISLSNYGPPTYTFRWERYANGIPVQGDGAYMEINLETGEVMSYSLTWTDATVPSPTGIISQEAAEKAFVEGNLMELQYFFGANEIIPVTRTPESESAGTPILVYRLSHPSGGVLDAFTGKPCVPEQADALFRGYGAEDRKQASIAEGRPLTPEEQDEIVKSARLISQEAAALAVKEALSLPDLPAPRDASLSKDYRDPELRLWSLSWTLGSASSQGYLWAQVDASTGEVRGFNLSMPGTGQTQKLKTRDQCLDIANSFLTRLNPERFKAVKLNDPSAWSAGEESASPSDLHDYTFNFQRMENGVVCPENGMWVTVDAAGGYVSSYSLTWSRAAFPPVGKVISAADAARLYLSQSPLTLTYVIRYEGDYNGTMALVYQPVQNPTVTPVAVIDATTGQALTWQGKPVSELPRAPRFGDIAGDANEKDIRWLGSMGLFGEYGDMFHPGEKATFGAVLRSMLVLRNGLAPTRELTDEQVLIQARNLGWVKEDTSLSSPLTRSAMARLVVRYLGIDYLAQRAGIFQMPFTDLRKEGAAVQGYAALTHGLGIMLGDGSGNFRPHDTVTRSQAAAILARTLRVRT